MREPARGAFFLDFAFPAARRIVTARRANPLRFSAGRFAMAAFPLLADAAPTPAPLLELAYLLNLTEQ
jgi:hypothetical protein